MNGKRSPEHRLIDSQIARLKLKRELLGLRAQLEFTVGRVASLQDALNAERGRTTGDSVTELADVSISRKLTDMVTANSQLRQALRNREREMRGIGERLSLAQRNIEQAHGQRQEMAARLHMSEQDGAKRERERIAAWLRSLESSSPIINREFAAEMILKGVPDVEADPAPAVRPAPVDAVGPAGPADPPR